MKTIGLTFPKSLSLNKGAPIAQSNFPPDCFQILQARSRKAAGVPLEGKSFVDFKKAGDELAGKMQASGVLLI